MTAGDMSRAGAEAGTAGITRRGLMMALSSPSGAGKSSIARALQRRARQLRLSLSATTRPPRPGEADGRDYLFVDAAEFAAMVARGEFLEHARVFGHAYGTPRAPVEAALAAGRDVLFDIDWQGTQQLAEAAREDLVSVFLLPPSMQELERRLHTRSQDSDAAIARRMAAAVEEMTHWDAYDYVVVNADFDDSVARIEAILAAERLRRDRQVGLSGFVNGLRQQR